MIVSPVRSTASPPRAGAGSLPGAPLAYKRRVVSELYTEATSVYQGTCFDVSVASRSDRPQAPRRRPAQSRTADRGGQGGVRRNRGRTSAWRRSPAAPASASAPSIATSPPATPSSRPSTAARCEQLADAATRSADVERARRGAARVDAPVRRLYRHQEGDRRGPRPCGRWHERYLRVVRLATSSTPSPSWWSAPAPRGDIRPDADPDDLLRALVGFTYGAAEPGWEASARRLIDILMDGLRTTRRGG